MAGERPRRWPEGRTALDAEQLRRWPEDPRSWPAATQGVGRLGPTQLAHTLTVALRDRYNDSWGSCSRFMTDIKKKLQDEISVLEHELHVELPKEILKARAHGDLSENAEYHAAKDRQGFVNARLGQLRKRLSEVAMIDFTKIPHDKVGLGSKVVVLDTKRDEEITYNLVTSEEADAANGKISTTSPIGRALLGREEGDTVNVQSPGGVKELEIRKLTTVYDVAE